MTENPNRVGESRPGPHHSDHWGIPFVIRDAATARYAVKLSGLPVFLLGLTYGVIGICVVTGLIRINEQTPEHIKWLMWGYFPIGLALIWAGLNIRKKSSWIVPVAACIYLIWTGVSVYYAIHWIQWLVPIPWVILSIVGLRGWWWLRRNYKH